MSTHTPGPWTVRGRPPDGYNEIWTVTAESITSDPPGRVTIVETHSGGGVIDDEAYANARLIAAAPELLALLREYAAYEPLPRKTIPHDRWVRARAAIARAEGK